MAKETECIGKHYTVLLMKKNRQAEDNKDQMEDVDKITIINIG